MKVKIRNLKKIKKSKKILFMEFDPKTNQINLQITALLVKRIM